MDACPAGRVRRHGGHAAGEVASALVVDSVRGSLRESENAESIQRLIEQAVQRANTDVFEDIKVLDGLRDKRSSSSPPAKAEREKERDSSRVSGTPTVKPPVPADPPTDSPVETPFIWGATRWVAAVAALLFLAAVAYWLLLQS